VSVRIERGAYEQIAEVSRKTMIPMARLIGACVPMLKERYGGGDGQK